MNWLAHFCGVALLLVVGVLLRLWYLRLDALSPKKYCSLCKWGKVRSDKDWACHHPNNMHPKLISPTQRDELILLHPESCRQYRTGVVDRLVRRLVGRPVVCGIEGYLWEPKEGA